jgi:LmbE family N-acetylglucosaminyl deacetylase
MKQIRAMMIGAHPDDCDFRCGGLALKYARAGHKVKFLAMCNGNGGHHELFPDEIAKRRREETLKVAEYAGIEYNVWEDSPDCELYADLSARARLVREIREFNPDIIFCSRPNDYHADHRNASILVQDASYLLIVPHYCPDTPAMEKVPAILYFYDHFKEPPFRADVGVNIDDVIDDKFEMLAIQESQLFEWLPYTKGTLAEVPEGKEARLNWLHEPRLPERFEDIDVELMNSNLIGKQSEYREAKAAFNNREVLIKKYGEVGKTIRFAEIFSICEYGSPFSDELIPF